MILFSSLTLYIFSSTFLSFLAILIFNMKNYKFKWKKYEDYFEEKQYNNYFVKFNDTKYSDCPTKYQFEKKFIQNIYDIYNNFDNSEDRKVDMASDYYD